jgi:hypothetical protein
MYSKGKYLIFQALLMLISPICSFFVSLRFYKNTISQIFILIFAFYFGYYCGFISDLATHYDDMVAIYVGRSLKEILRDPRTFLIGHDLYHFVLKFILSRFDVSEQVFGAFAASLYALSFLFFFRQLKTFYNSKLSMVSGLLLLCVVFVVEYYWYQGLRFWTGIFFFLGFYMKYLNTNKIKFLLLSFISPLFHYTLTILLVAIGLNWLLKKIGNKWRVVLLIISFFVRLQNVDFLPYLMHYFPWMKFLGLAITNSEIRKSVLIRMDSFRQHGNIFYDYRTDFLFFFALIFVIVFLRRHIPFKAQYGKLFFMFVTILTIANFGYGDLIFYDRFFHLSVLLLYIFIFVQSVIYYDNIKDISLPLILCAFIPMSYAILTQLISQREFLYHMELIFGNFFVSWDANSVVHAIR